LDNKRQNLGIWCADLNVSLAPRRAFLAREIMYEQGLNKKVSNKAKLPMNRLQSVEEKEEEAIRKIAHPAIGEIYCINEVEARATLHEIFVDRLYLQEGVSILPGDIVLDVGANIGLFTLFAAKQGAQVYAYEPVPPTFEVLQYNTRLHHLESVAHTRKIGISDRVEERLMFHYPSCSVCDSWTAQDDLFELMSENWENTLSLLKVADPDQYKAISSLGSKTLQEGAVREIMEKLSASPVQIKCEFDTLSGVIARENIQSIGLLKLDAELADWEILNGLKVEDWPRIRQLAMEVHLESDVVPISHFLSERGFGQIIAKKLTQGTHCLWARK
jgi:FkbM family methyltransferase